MQKNVVKSIVGPLIGLCCVCSSLDQYTSVGSDIIQDTDPTLISFGDNFFSMALDSGCAAESFSLPGNSGSGFGRHSGKLTAGTAGTNLTYGYIEFPVDYTFAKRFDTTHIFDSIVFVIDTLSDTLYPGTITSDTRLNLYPCTDSTAAFLATPEAGAPMLATLQQSADSSAHWTGTLTDSAFADSIFNQCRASKQCYDDEDTGTSTEKAARCDDKLPTRFFVALFTSDNTFAWFKSDVNHSPAMVIHAHYTDHRSGGDTTIGKTDTLRGYPSFIAAENETTITRNNALPLSSWLQGRIAVFKFDLKPLWDTMQATGFHEVLSAGFGLKPSLRLTDNMDSTPTINYLLSDKRYTDIASINDQFAEVNAFYKPEVELEKPSDSSEIILPVEYHLQHYLDGKESSFYLYIRLTSSAVIWNQEVLWSEPRFKAVLTTIN